MKLEAKTNFEMEQYDKMPTEIKCSICGKKAKQDRWTEKSHLWKKNKNIRYLCECGKGTQIAMTTKAASRREAEEIRRSARIM